MMNYGKILSIDYLQCGFEAFFFKAYIDIIADYHLVDSYFGVFIFIILIPFTMYFIIKKLTEK